MSLRSILPDRNSIATRLAAWFLLIALVPCLMLLAVTAYFSRQSLRETVRQRLTVICDAKAAQLEEYITERKADARVLINASGFVDAATRLGVLVKAGKAGTDEYRAEADAIRPRLAAFSDANAYSNFHLFDPDGVLLISYRPGLDVGPGLESGPLRATELAGSFRRTRALVQPVLSDMQIYPGRSAPTSYILGPILKEGAIIGVVALELDGTSIFRNFNTYFGLGETGDATLAMREGDEITYVAPSRYNPLAAFHDRVRLGSSEGLDMQSAVAGNRGYGEMVDHRGIAVVTAWTYLPSFRWGMTVKQGSDEAFELLRT